MCAVSHRKEKKLCRKKVFFMEEELTEEMLKELSNGKGDDEGE